MRYDELKEEFARVNFQIFDYNYSEMHCEYKIGNVNFYVILDWETTTFNHDTGLYNYVVRPKKASGIQTKTHLQKTLCNLRIVITNGLATW